MSRFPALFPLGRSARAAGLLGCALILASTGFAGLAGCKSATPPLDDAALSAAVNSQLAADSSIAGQSVQGTVQNGVATLNGSVSNDAQRTIAARDAAGVKGVKEVINNLGIGPAPTATASVAPSQPLAVQRPRTTTALLPRSEDRNSRPQDRDNRSQRDPAYQQQPAPIERTQPAAASAPVAPPPPPQPIFRNVTVPAGTTLPVRVTQTLDSASTQTGESFSGAVASDVVIDGVVAVPQGSAVSGTVDAVQEAAHFKGSSLLTVSLGSVKVRGERVSVSSAPYSVKGNGRGKNTAEKAGGGAAVGAILGGIFGGGKGAAIGAAAGGGVGAGANAVTRGQQVQIPSETVVRFQTSSPISVRVRTDGGGRDNADGDLQHRPR